MNTPRKPIRIYVDTSVIGGCLDEEFREPSLRLIEQIRTGGAVMVLSDITQAELASAPTDVQRIVAGLPRDHLELIHQSIESETLAETYISESVVSHRMRTDAQHIAVATIAKVDVLVSWNFRHIVNLDRIHGFNAVNLRAGYALLEIRSPLEVWKDED
jgi:predicted nucleic acid-binding protein